MLVFATKSRKTFVTELSLGLLSRKLFFFFMKGKKTGQCRYVFHGSESKSQAFGFSYVLFFSS